MTEPLGASEILIARYAGPRAPAKVWRLQQSDAGWTPIAPDGLRGTSFWDPVEAIVASGSCEYEPGVGLHIETSGLIEEFDLLPALEGWTKPHDAPVEDVDWWGHEALGWAHEAISNRSGSDQFELDPSRIIRIDGAVCAVHQAERDRSDKGRRHLVIFVETDPLWPRFFKQWATTDTDNGYGSGRYEIGEITPGFEGEAFSADEIASLRIGPLSESSWAPTAEEMVSWISGNVSMTAGFEEYELEANGDSATAVFPEEAQYGEASGRLGPAVLQPRGSEGIQEAPKSD